MDAQVALAIGAHPDDIELGCGGTLARARREGTEVVYVTFCDCAASNPGADLVAEGRAAATILGAREIIQHDFPVRHLRDHRQDVADLLYQIAQRVKPDTVLVPHFDDLHPDHQAVAEGALRVFRRTTLQGYENSWSTNGLPKVFVRLTSEDADKKIEALREFVSQQHRHYFSEHTIRGLMAVRGAHVGAAWAEAYLPLRIVV